MDVVSDLIGDVLHHERFGAETNDVITHDLLHGKVVRHVSYHHGASFLALDELPNSNEGILQPRGLRVE